MGEIQYKRLNRLIRKCCSSCEHRDIFIFTSYISSQENKEVDSQSRVGRAEVAWSLNLEAFLRINRHTVSLYPKIVVKLLQKC